MRINPEKQSSLMLITGAIIGALLLLVVVWLISGGDRLLYPHASKVFDLTRSYITAPDQIRVGDQAVLPVDMRLAPRGTDKMTTHLFYGMGILRVIEILDDILVAEYNPPPEYRFMPTCRQLVLEKRKFVEFSMLACQFYGPDRYPTFENFHIAYKQAVK